MSAQSFSTLISYFSLKRPCAKFFMFTLNLGKSNRSKGDQTNSSATSEAKNENNFLYPPQPPSPIRNVSLDLQDQENSRMEKFGKVLAGPTTDLGDLFLFLRFFIHYAPFWEKYVRFFYFKILVLNINYLRYRRQVLLIIY